MIQDAPKGPDCKPTDVKMGNDLPLKRVLIPLADYPNAVCNDGSPGAIFIRSSEGAGNESKWLFHVQGGGGCSDYQSCYDRWCGLTASYNASRMSTNYGPISRADAGIMKRDPSNPLGNANIVFIFYCNSDKHRGDKGDVVMVDDTDPDKKFRINVRGHAVMEAAIDMLLKGEVVSDDKSVTVPKLSEASSVIFSGTSAGSAGVAFHLDWLAGKLDPSTKLHGVLDASLHHDVSTITDATILAQWDSMLAAGHEAGTAMNMFHDQSCLDAHKDDPKQCASGSHVQLNHITTPFFVRHDMLDPKSLGKVVEMNPALSMEDAAPWSRATMLLVPSLLSTAEEKAAMTRTPGIFSQACGQHVGLTNENYTFFATIDTPGPKVSLHQALGAWLNGDDVALIDKLPPKSLSYCPPTDGALD